MIKRFLLFVIVLCSCSLLASAQTSNIEVDKLLALVNDSPKEPKASIVKLSEKDAKAFRKHISLINNNSFGLTLVANAPAKKAAAAKNIQYKKVKVDAYQASFFRQHIQLFSGNTFQLDLAPNFTEYGPENNYAMVPVTATVKLSVSAPTGPGKKVALKNISSSQRTANHQFVTGVYSLPPLSDPEENSFIKSTTSKELQDYLYSKIVVNMVDLDNMFASIARDTLRQRVPQKMPANVTALKQQVGLVYNDTLRAALFQEIADHYLAYDSITIRTTRNYYQEEALEFTMKALHVYSKLGDQNGLRMSYANLAKVYKAQKKYSEAKWFILQANTIARQQKDVPQTIATLVELAGIKMYIKDYKLAQTDLDEALQLASKNKYAKQESTVQANFAILYGHLNDTVKSNKALKRHDAIEDSIRKAAENQRLAEIKKRDSVETAKKKLLSSAVSKPIKNSSIKKVASL